MAYVHTERDVGESMSHPENSKKQLDASTLKEEHAKKEDGVTINT